MIDLDKEVKTMYKVIAISVGLFADKEKKLEDELNKIAAEGWELISVAYAGGGFFTAWKKK